MNIINFRKLLLKMFLYKYNINELNKDIKLLIMK